MSMQLIRPSDRIFIAGARGMAGSAIVRALKRSGYGNPEKAGALLTPNRQELDSKTGMYDSGLHQKSQM